ncbi:MULTISPECIES: hypothetical protein [unclassified Pseudoalteromonas]|nr:MULTISPECIES: hypothetical protein [unclassified Pseudoalteromonas]MCF6456023.1 hypothetical protein [Pseudoalteromonas sp. MMG024]
MSIQIIGGNMMTTKRYLIEFAISEDDSVQRYVAGPNLSLDGVTAWAEKLEQEEEIFESFTIKDVSD